MSRIECKDCDFYDPYACDYRCTKYDNQHVEFITYCTWRTIKGKRINDSMNPLHMERILRWNEVMFDGEIRLCHNDFYCPDGIITWGDDERMEDPVTGKVQLKDGTVLTSTEYFETTPQGKALKELMVRLKK